MHICNELYDEMSTAKFNKIMMGKILMIMPIFDKARTLALSLSGLRQLNSFPHNHDL